MTDSLQTTDTLLMQLLLYSAAVEVCFTDGNYEVDETVGTVIINLRITGKYFVLMNATVSCQEDSATGENDMK